MISDLEVISPGIITNYELNFFASFVLIPSGYLHEHLRLCQAKMSSSDSIFDEKWELKVP